MKVEIKTKSEKSIFQIYIDEKELKKAIKTSGIHETIRFFGKELMRVVRTRSEEIKRDIREAEAKKRAKNK